MKTTPTTPTPLDAKRAKERAKYLTLANKPGSTYGSSNHGRAAIPLIREGKPRFVVDFGCGRNDLVRELRRLGIDGLGVDFAFPEADLVRPMHATALQAGIADVVTSFDALEHLLPEDVDLTLAEMRRVAVPRGRFIFSICTRPSTTTVAGEGLHPTVRPLDWWLERIARVGVAGRPQAGSRYIVGRFKSDGGAAVRENQSDIAALQAGLKARKPARDGLRLYTAPPTFESVSLSGFYRGRSAFLMLSGPSLKQVDLSLLDARGIVTMAVNNAWSVRRPTLWTCVDDPGRFIDVGWKDPGILKFVPTCMWDKRLKVMNPDGTLRNSAFKVHQMPGVLFFRRSDHFDHERSRPGRLGRSTDIGSPPHGSPSARPLLRGTSLGGVWGWTLDGHRASGRGAGQVVQAEMWTSLGGPFIRDREPAIWAHPVAFSGSDLALTAPEIMPSSRHPSDRSYPSGLTENGQPACSLAGDAGVIRRSQRYSRETSMANSPSPVRRLTTYWKIEAGNAVLIPAIAAYFVLRSGATVTPALVLSGLACSFLLVIGTIVLRMMLRKARGEPNPTKGRIALLAWMRWPAIGLCVAAAAALGAQCIPDGVQLDARFVAPATLLLLAVLEYINYYHFQLQHFDHAPDWRRLVSGRGFRRSHLAREIDRWKRERRGA